MDAASIPGIEEYQRAELAQHLREQLQDEAGGQCDEPGAMDDACDAVLALGCACAVHVGAPCYRGSSWFASVIRPRYYPNAFLVLAPRINAPSIRVMCC